MARLGILGGTFDPPHIGHLILAAEAQAQLGLDKILWVLTPDPPHKTSQPITPVAQRLAMLQAALEGNPSFKLSRVDLDRPAPHFAVDTMRLLRQQLPGQAFFYLMGGDSLADLPRWRTPQEFVLACDGIGVAQRPGRRPDLARLEQQLPGLTSRLCWIAAPRLDIASQDIRRRLKEGRPVRYFLPEAVYRLIESQGLYR